MERTTRGWEITHPREAFEVEVFDLTGRIFHRTSGVLLGLPCGARSRRNTFRCAGSLEGDPNRVSKRLGDWADNQRSEYHGYSRTSLT